MDIFLRIYASPLFFREEKSVSKDFSFVSVMFSLCLSHENQVKRNIYVHALSLKLAFLKIK